MKDRRVRSGRSLLILLSEVEAMKTLFHPKWFSYNKKASELDEEVRKVMEPIIGKWLDDGYSPRDIESVIHTTIDIAICSKHMYRNSKLIQEERAAKNERKGKIKDDGREDEEN